MNDATTQRPGCMSDGQLWATILSLANDKVVDRYFSFPDFERSQRDAEGDACSGPKG